MKKPKVTRTKQKDQVEVVGNHFLARDSLNTFCTLSNKIWFSNYITFSNKTQIKDAIDVLNSFLKEI